jgi:Na+/H+ antiporter NhaA
MHQDARRTRTLALLLAVIFLGAQFHFCADLSTGPASTHMCPVCSAAGSAVTTPAVLIVGASISHRLEIRGYTLGASTDIPRSISPRAPPTFGSIS